MATITTRNTKGSPLSFTELDANFTNLNTAKYEAGASPTFVTVSTLTNAGKVILATDAGGSINMGRIDGTESTPFIDFNTSTIPVDYNVRLITYGPSAGLGGGILSILASETTTAGLLTSGTYRNLSKSVVTTAGVTATTLATQATYFTGTAGAGFAITLPPAATVNLDGMIYTVMSTVARPSTTWVNNGAAGVIGAPTALVANTPVRLQFHLATNQWFIC